MATVTATDFLVATGIPGLWVRLHNNVSGTDYYSTAVSDPQGSYTYTVPAGDYSLYVGATATVPGTPTLRSSHYQVAIRNGDDAALNSATATIGPYSPTAVIGGADYGAAVRMATKPWADITHPAYGAVDGADSSAAITAVIAALASGGCAEIPSPATYLFSGQFIPATGTTFRGDSRGSALLKIKNAAATNTQLVSYLTTHVHFEGFGVDGNKANNPSHSSAPVALQADNCSIQNVRVFNAKSNGLNSNNNGCSIIASHVETPDQSGIQLGSTASYDRIALNRIDTPGNHGIFLSSGPNNYNIIALNTIRNPGAGYIGIALGSQNNYCAVIGNSISTTAAELIDCGSCLDVAVIGNVGTSSDPTVIAYSNDTGQRNTFVGNCIALAGIGMAAYDSMDAASNSGSDNIYACNTIYGCTSAGVGGGHDVDGQRYVIVLGNVSKNGSATLSGFAVHRYAATSAIPDRLLYMGNIAYDDKRVKLQRYGLEIISGLSRSVNILHNDFRGNLLGALLDGGPDTYTHGVLGYNPRGALTPPAIPATTVLFQNPFNVDCTVYIKGGTLTDIAVGGLPVPANWATQPTTSTATTGGTLAPATYYYRVAARNAAGHTIECVEFSRIVPAGTSTNTVTITLPGDGLRGTTGWDIYGRSTGAELLMASNWQKGVFLDDGSVTPSGAMPGTDTTGSAATGISAAAGAGAVHSVRVMYGQCIKLTYSVAPTWTWFGD